MATTGLTKFLEEINKGIDRVPTNAGYSFDNGQIEENTTGWTVYKDAAQYIPVDGIGGTPSFTFTVNTTNPLIGLGDGLLTKPASNDQGEGISYNFTVDRGVANGTAQISFVYETSSNYTDKDLGVYVYDVDNNFLIYPSIVDLPGTNSTPATFQATFQTSNSNNYRLIIHCQTVSTTAWTMRLDNVQVGNKDVAIGAAIGNWVSYVPTFSAGFGVTSNVAARYRRVGSSIEIVGAFTAGTTTSALGTISLPAGLTCAYTQVAGTWRRTVNASNTSKRGTFLAVSGDSFYYITNDSSPPSYPVNTAIGISSIIATGESIYFELAIPIAQWTSNINLTSDFQEFASNSNTADADEASYVPANNVLGTGGSLIPALAIGLGMYNRYVRFQKPIQSTDLLIVEVDQGNGMWVSVPDRLGPWVSQGGYNTGIALTPQSDKYLVKVSFGRNGYAPSAGTYASAGTASWSVINTWKWRVRKISNGNMAESLLAVPPIGSTYVQFPAQNNPGELWPNTTWSNISSMYAGAFFRAEGGAALAFGGGQQEAQNLAHVHSNSVGNQSVDHTHSGTTGTESAGHTHTIGGSTGVSSGLTNNYLRITTSSQSIDGRPSNVGGTAHYFYNGSNSIDHSHSLPSATGGISANHTHAFTTGVASASHNHAVTINSSGGADLRPINYSVRIWKRTA